MQETTLTMARIVWKMRQVMADRKISNKKLAEYMDKHPTGISRLKSQDTLPAIGSDQIELIREAINALSPTTYNVCSLAELVHIEE